MYKFLLRPRWIAVHLLIIALVAIMMSLANWQWHRYHQRIAFNQTLIERVNGPARPLEDLLQDFPEVSKLDWRNVTVTGVYLQGNDVSVVNVSQGGRAGFDPVTPLQLDDGRLILVNRGFIPLGAQVLPAPRGSVSLQGHLRAPAVKRLGAITDAASGVLTEVQRIDTERLSKQLPSQVLPVYVEMIASQPTDDPMLSRIAEPIFGNGPHLGYTGQWILFSLCALGGWFALVRREVARTKQSHLGV